MKRYEVRKGKAMNPPLCKTDADRVSGAIFIIGLGIIFLTGMGFWPGILFV